MTIQIARGYLKDLENIKQGELVLVNESIEDEPEKDTKSIVKSQD